MLLLRRSCFFRPESRVIPNTLCKMSRFQKSFCMLFRKRAHLSKNFAAFQAQCCNKNTCNTTSMKASVHFQQGVEEELFTKPLASSKWTKKPGKVRVGRERKEVGGGGLREYDWSNRKENHLIFQKGWHLCP